MKLLQFALVSCLVVGLAGCGSPTTKKTAATTTGGPAPVAATNKEKIVGVWEVTKTEGEMPKGATIEFTTDGKMKFTMEVKGKKETFDGSYTIDNDKLMTSMKGPDGKMHKDTITIVKLTGKELETKDEKGKIDEFKKK